MTKDELFKPRYKVIADYPNSPFGIGEVFMAYTSTDGTKTLYKWRDSYLLHSPEKYPAIFKKLEWWEERKIDEMPEYVKLKDENYFLKVHSYHTDNTHGDDAGLFYIAEDCGWQGFTGLYEPATKQEYLEYQNKPNLK